MRIIINEETNENPKMKAIVHSVVRLGIALHNAEVIIKQSK